MRGVWWLVLVGAVGCAGGKDSAGEAVEDTAAQDTDTGDTGDTADTGDTSDTADTGDIIDADEAVTDAGLYTLAYTTNPSPPTSGATALEVMLSDASGAPVEGALLTLTPYMPDMGHGIHGEPEVREDGGGAYVATWSYSMGGYWEVTVEISAAPGDDVVVLPFEVE